MKPQAAGDNWRLDGDTITVTIPMAWKRRGGRKVIIAPDGGDAWAPAKPRPDETLIRALARAHRWKRMLEEGRCRSAAEIAEAESITRSFVNRLLRLTLLAPDIQEAILGRQPKDAAGGRRCRAWEELTRADGPDGRWEEQRQFCSWSALTWGSARNLKAAPGCPSAALSGVNRTVPTGTVLRSCRSAHRFSQRFEVYPSAGVVPGGTEQDVSEIARTVRGPGLECPLGQPLHR